MTYLRGMGSLRKRIGQAAAERGAPADGPASHPTGFGHPSLVGRHTGRSPDLLGLKADEIPKVT